MSLCGLGGHIKQASMPKTSKKTAKRTARKGKRGDTVDVVESGRVEKKPRRKAPRGEVASRAILKMQYGMTTEDKKQKTESSRRFQRRANNVSKNIRSGQRIGKRSATMIQRDRKDYVSNVIKRAVDFTDNRRKKQVQKRDIYSALEDIGFLKAIAPHTVRVG